VTAQVHRGEQQSEFKAICLPCLDALAVTAARSRLREGVDMNKVPTLRTFAQDHTPPRLLPGAGGGG
jgi:hypothetical protein